MHSKKTAWEEAYLSAYYELLDPVCSIKIGFPSPDALQSVFPNMKTWAWLTAYNPASLALPTFNNKENQAKLEQHVVKLGKPFLNGISKDPNGLWPEEASILIIDIKYSEALVIARTFGQNAFLHCTLPGEVKLEWT